MQPEDESVQFIRVSVAVGTTTAGIYAVDPLDKAIFVSAANASDAEKERAQAEFVRDHRGWQGGFEVIVNTPMHKLGVARELLIDRILARRMPAPEVCDMVIGLIGDALDQQLGKDNRIAGNKKVKPNIYAHLETVRVPLKLRTAYQGVHKYYRNSKHGDAREHAEVIAELAGPRGRSITAGYFERVRQILVRYYRSIGHPIGPQLDPVDYERFGVDLT